MDLNANANTRWMTIFVEELAANGLEAVCIAPGSRSTPLTLAFANQPGVRVYRHLDERSAGFFALGLALATGKPVALVCTSGTAAANFHPAVIEAYYSQVPLLVLTADRPPELRGSGANQTIDQVKMFGDHARWAVDLPTPQDDDPPNVIRHLRTLAARAYATAAGLVRGPVHLNFPFRKPLEPDGATNGVGPRLSAAAARPHTRITRGRMMPTPEQLAAVAGTLAGRRGVIICGPNCPGGDFPAAVTALAERTGFPILADALSNLRHGAHVSDLVLGGYQWWLPVADETVRKPEVVLRFGAVPTSASLAAYLGHAAPEHHYHVREDGEWADDLHLTHELIQADETAFCRGLVEQLDAAGHAPEPEWAAGFVRLERAAWEQLEQALAQSPLFDGLAVYHTLSAAAEDTLVFAGNSMPVRHVDAFDRPSPKRLTFFGNRGASGIDGNVSTALGLAAGAGKPVMALLGDITFYHDMNGLLAVRQHALEDSTFVVLNNDGGGIFQRLPIAQHDPPFTDLFLTPHGLTFEGAAAIYGLRYQAIEDAKELAAHLASETSAQLIEVRTGNAADFRRMTAVASAVAAAIQTNTHQREET